MLRFKTREINWFPANVVYTFTLAKAVLGKIVQSYPKV